MADVFVSYARENRDTAAAVADVLAGHGWSVWWDREIPVGSGFDRVIEQQLDAARCVVVLWSRHSVDSDWVRAEAGEGVRRGVLVPARLEADVTPPLAFRNVQTADLAGWDPPRPHPGLDDLVRGVQAKTGPTAASPLPSVSDDWRCELVGRTRWTRTLRVRHGGDAVLVEIRQHVFGDHVLVDGQTVWKGSTGVKRTLEFEVPIGSARVPGVVTLDSSVVTTSFKTVRLEVAGRLLYREGPA